jgi:hypothetical protein
MTTLKTSLIGAFALSASVCAMADVNVPIDPVAYCLDTTTMTGGKVTFQLPAGRYLAWLVDDAMYCRSFDTNRYCHIDTVVISAPTSVNKSSPARWGQTIRETETSVEIPGTAPATVSAFVLDTFCTDNIGSATLHFQPF